MERPEGRSVGEEKDESGGGESGPDSAEVETVVDKRTVRGAVQYKVKWKGWNNRYNCWRGLEGLQCQELIDRYEEACLGLSRAEVSKKVVALLYSLAVAGAVAQNRLQVAAEVQ